MVVISVLKCVFQSTPSVGRATGVGSVFFLSSLISIHALRGEGDKQQEKSSRLTTAFQSTPSVGRATMSETELQLQSGISIHALRGEGDIKLHI